jgi:uncharacterized membrane protein
LSNLKEKLRKPAFVIALFLPGILLLLLPLYRPADVPFFLLFLGRLHPLVLHFPIVLIILCLLFEIARHYGLLKLGDSILLIVLLTAACSTLLSVGAGYFLFASGDYSGNLMEQHYWAGVITGFAIFTTVGLFLIYWSTSRFYAIYIGALVLSNISVAYTSHLGGSITHGQDYLTEHLELVMSKSEAHEPKAEAEMLIYEDMIAPIFESKCLSCHNAQKAKGSFVMTSYENIMKAGESNLPSLTPQVPEKSELFNRTILPEDHKDHMPPEGKTPLTENEITLLKYWIKSGAQKELMVQEAKKNDTLKSVIENLLPELSRYRRKAHIANIKLKVLEEELAEVAKTLSVKIEKDSAADEGFFTLAMSFPPAPLTNEQFKILHPYAEVFSKASLVSSGLDDDGLYYIGQMVNLEKLFLQKTRIDGSGIIYLQNLTKLKVLNLSFTKFDDKAAIDLLKIPSLQEVYLYRTQTSRQVAEALQKNRAGLKIYFQEGPYF